MKKGLESAPIHSTLILTDQSTLERGYRPERPAGHGQIQYEPNTNLPTGGTASFGFQASNSGTNATTTNFVLNGSSCTHRSRFGLHCCS